MSKFITALLSIALPLASWASCTYDSTTPRVVIVTCTTTTESAPTLITEGLSLAGLEGFTVAVTSSGTSTAGGTLNAYLWLADAATPVWVRAPDLDLTAQALTGQAWPGFIVTVAKGRIDYKPTGLGANTVKIYLIGQAK